MAGLPARAQLRLAASTSLPPAACLELVGRTAGSAKAGANYAGKGLSLDIVASDANSLSVAMTDRFRELCTFTVYARASNGGTELRVGGIDDGIVIKHSIMFVPVGKEIAGYGYYKRFLAQVEAAMRAADSGAKIAVGMP